MQAIMHNATERLRGSGILDRVVKPGEKAPDFTLNDQNGQAVALSSLLASGPVIMSVFRGFW
jgi:peroxiredoxin